MNVGGVSRRVPDRLQRIRNVLAQNLPLTFGAEDPSGPQWSLTGRGNLLRGQVRVEAEWVCLDFPVDRRERCGTVSPWRTLGSLRLNHRLGRARWVIDPATGGLHLRTDFPLEPAGSIGLCSVNSLIAESCRDLKAALRGDASTPPATPAEQSVDADDDARVLRLCESAGWPAVASPSTVPRVDLRVTDRVHQAVVQRNGVGIRLRVELPGGPLRDLPPDCRQATAMMLLRAAGLMRLVSASLGDGEHDGVPEFFVQLPAAADATLMNHAFSALHCATREYAEKVEALRSQPVLARAWLEVQG